MTYEELVAKYSVFVKHERFYDLKKEADYFRKHPNFTESDKSWGEWSYNRFFLPFAFDKPIPGAIIQTRDRFTVNVDGYLIDINTTYAPEFLSKKDYLLWLYETIKV